MCVPVLRRHLSEVCLDDGGVRSSSQAALVCAGTEVLPAFGFHGRIDTLGCLPRKKGLVGGQGRCQGGDGEDGDEIELHDVV